MASIIYNNLTSPEFGYVVLACAGIGLHVIATGFRVGAARGEAFDKAYFQQPEVKTMLDDHKKATGDAQLPRGGYPDMGNGRYSDQLSYAKWLAFNNAQRAHGNYVEGAASIITFTALSGLTWNPKYTAALASVYLLGRELYAYGYANKGANARIYGVALFDIALLTLCCTSVYGGLRVAKLLV